MIKAKEFLDAIFADIDNDTEVVCVARAGKKDGQTLFWNMADDHKVFTRWKPKSDAWYFCVSTVNGTMNDKGTALRRRTADVVRYHCLVLDDIRSMHNVGSAFRTCDAFLVEKIYLCGITAQPPHREIQKSSCLCSTGDASQMTEEEVEIRNSFEDEKGTLYLTMSWRVLGA